MESSTQQQPDREPTGDPSGEQRAGQGKGTTTTEYVVYEASGEESERTGAHEILTARWAGEAEDEAAARWAAVDASEELSERSQDSNNPPVLLAVPVRRVKPKVTQLSPDQIKEAQELAKKRLRR